MLLHALHIGFLTVPLLLTLWSSGPLRRSPWPAIGAMLYFGRVSALNALANIRAPHEWDYGCFWLYGQIAAAHKNLYDPNVFAHFPLPFRPTSDFVLSVLNVGFPYPPPTIALFLPLAFIHGISNGLGAWYCVQFSALAAAAWILARTFTPKRRAAGAALIFALVLALPATQDNIGNAQTNFLLLLLIALAFTQRMTARGGMWTMLAVWVKPYTAVLLLLALLQKQWRRLAVAAATAIGSLCAAAVVLGPHTTLSYFQSNPAAREPVSTFFEQVNQSLLAEIVRAHATLPTQVAPLHEPTYIGIGAAILVLTAILCARAARGSALTFALTLLSGMLLYPATLSSYGVILILPLLIVWQNRAALPGGTVSAAAVIALVTLMQSSLDFGFGANFALWFVCGCVLALSSSTLRDPQSVADLALVAGERPRLAA